MKINNILNAWQTQWKELSLDTMKLFLYDCGQQTMQIFKLIWQHNRHLFLISLIQPVLSIGAFIAPPGSLLSILLWSIAVAGALFLIGFFFYLIGIYSITLHHLSTNNPERMPSFNKFLIFTYLLLAWISAFITGVLFFMTAYAIFFALIIGMIYLLLKSINKDSPLPMLLALGTLVAIITLFLMGQAGTTISTIISYPISGIISSIPFFYFMDIPEPNWTKKILSSLLEGVTFTLYCLPTILAYGITMNIIMTFIFMIPSMAFFIILPLMALTPLIIIPIIITFIILIMATLTVEITIGYNLYLKYKNIQQDSLTKELFNLT